MLHIASFRLKIIDTPNGHEVRIAANEGEEGRPPRPEEVVLARATTKDEADRFIKALLSALAMLQKLATLEASKRGGRS